jgi:ring-1,2-phenylacetyl-CoA epoxidase subunit PaaD
VHYDDDTLVVAVTPTYSGCPATAIINLDIETALRAKGVEKLELERRLFPPWTTDWISEEGRRKLREFGVAPPVDGSAADGRVAARIAALGQTPVVRCPRCDSSNTTKVSQFGSTPCKANYACRDCLEPFDYFKCI